MRNIKHSSHNIRRNQDRSIDDCFRFIVDSIHSTYSTEYIASCWLISLVMVRSWNLFECVGLSDYHNAKDTEKYNTKNDKNKSKGWIRVEWDIVWRNVFCRFSVVKKCYRKINFDRFCKFSHQCIHFTHIHAI